jgi:hypothetical protein
MYELNGSATHPEDVSVSKIEMSFTAVEVSEGERWQLLGEVIWEPNPECESPPQMLCSEWQVSLDVSALPHSDYNLEVSSEFDPDYPVDIFGDDPDERCSYNCGDLRPTCTGGLCQHGGTKPEVWILPASPAFYAIAPTLEVS